MKVLQLFFLAAFFVLLIGHASGQITLDVDVPPGWMGDAFEGDGWGYWAYGTDSSFIAIYYDFNVPEELVGHENDPEALVAYARDYAGFTPDEWGIDLVDGQTAGHALSITEDEYDGYLVFVKDDILIEIDYFLTFGDYDSGTALIDSISISTTGPEPTPTPTPTPTPAPSRNLVAYYTFDMDTEDHSGQGNDGTNDGATFVSGVKGEALRFDGVNDFVSAPVNINPDAMPQMTITLWARADAVTGTIISHDNGGYDRGIDIDYRGGGTGWSAFSGTGAVLGYHPVTVGEWVFLAAVYDQAAGTVKLYVNDVLYEEAGSLGSGWDYLTIGKNPSFGAYFPGTIDEVRIYNYALSAAEIQELYQSVSIPPAVTPTPSPSPSPPPRGVEVLSPQRLTATLSPGESIVETKKYTTAEGKPITRVDVLFAFDLTSSMGEELSTMQTESQNIMDNLRELAPDSAFGVASFMDYPGYYTYGEYSNTYGGAEDYPWNLDRGITTNTANVRSAINTLTLGNGQDYPESYSRALYETYADPSVGWRTGTKKIVIIFGDDVPHDPAYGTGLDPGRDGLMGTGDDLYFADVVADLKAQGITVLALHSGTDARPWQYVADETNGAYYGLTHNEAALIPGAIANLIEAEVATIGELRLRPESGYENWVSVTPTEYTDVGGGSTGYFDVRITVPEGTSSGMYEFRIELLGDGTVLGEQHVVISVPATEPTPDTATTPTPTLSPVLTPTSALSPVPTPTLHLGAVGTVDPLELSATLAHGESITETKRYTTAEGQPITRLDVLFCFDLTASMGEELEIMQTESQHIMDRLRELAPDSAFGVASFMDYPGYYTYDEYSAIYGGADDYPWALDQKITSDTELIRAAINGLTLGDGQDYPESYSRALYETYADHNVGWRAGAKKIVILFGDDIPHDPAFQTGVDPGRDAEMGTADDLYFDEVVSGLQSYGITVLVLYSGVDLQPWEYVTEETGGSLYKLAHAEAVRIPEAITSLVQAEVERISMLTLQASPEYEEWVSFSPVHHTDVPGGETVAFTVTVTIPEDARSGTHTFSINVVGDGTVLGTQTVTITVPSHVVIDRIEPEAVSHLAHANVSMRSNGDTIFRFSFRPSVREEAAWLSHRFELAKSLEIALEKTLMRDVSLLEISSREISFLVPDLIEPMATTYVMPEVDLKVLEVAFQAATDKATDGELAPVSMVPTTATIVFPDEYTETFEGTSRIPETAHSVFGPVQPWIVITNPPSGVVLQNATSIHVQASEEITRVSLVIQGSTWSEQFEDTTRPFVFEWNVSDLAVAGGLYRLEATGFADNTEIQNANDSVLVDVKQPIAPPLTVIGMLIASVSACAVAAIGVSANIRGMSRAKLKFSFYRSVLAAQYRTTFPGDLLRITFGILALSIAYTLQCTLTMRTVFFSLPDFMPFSEQPQPFLLPTFAGLAPNAWDVFLLIVALVGVIIVVREAVQYFFALLLNAEVGAIVDRTASTMMLVTAIFGHPFGYPLRAVLWEDLSPRIKGFICLGNIMSLFSLLAFFYYLVFVWYPDAWWVVWVGGAGIPAVAMTLVHSLIPFVGEEGTVIYEWNRFLALLLLVVAGLAYLTFMFNLSDPLTLQFSLGMFSLSFSGLLMGGLLLYSFMKWINFI